jgi:hypothetical protein
LVIGINPVIGIVARLRNVVDVVMFLTSALLLLPAVTK